MEWIEDTINDASFLKQEFNLFLTPLRNDYKKLYILLKTFNHPPNSSIF